MLINAQYQYFVYPFCLFCYLRVLRLLGIWCMSCGCQCKSFPFSFDLLIRKPLLYIREQFYVQESKETYLFWMKQQFKFLKIQQLFTVLLWHCLFTIHFHCCMSKFVQLTILLQEKSCWRLAVTNSLSSSPVLKDIEVIFGCIWENVSKPAVGCSEVDCNDYISFSLRRHVIQDQPIFSTKGTW